MKILIIEPYFDGSHRYFHEILCDSLRYLGHEIFEVTMKARHWRWRIQGAHFSLAPQVNEYIAGQEIDLIWTNSMVDICALKGLLVKPVPIMTFFHEHQMSYPLEENHQQAQLLLRDHVFPGIHASQLLASSLSIFSSEFNRDSFFSGIERFFKSRPEKIENFKSKNESALCPIPLIGDFCLDHNFHKRPKRILWNHRWEFDKNPLAFCELINTLKRRQVDFSLELLGQKRENIFDKLKADDGIEVKSFGGPKHRGHYLEKLSQCRILPVTSHHDFFGISVREAILSGVIPLLPRRMVYPECIPKELHNILLYDNPEELAVKCEKLLNDGLEEAQYGLLVNFHKGNDISLFRQNLKGFLDLLNS